MQEPVRTDIHAPVVLASPITLGQGIAVQGWGVSVPSFRDVTGAVVDAGVGAWERTTDAGRTVVGFAQDSLAGVVDYLAPGLLPFLRGGYMGQITDLFCSGLDALVGALLRPLESIDFMSSIEDLFTRLTTGVKGMWSYLGRGASAGLGLLLSPLVEALDEFGGPLVQSISSIADFIEDVLSSVWEHIGVPVLDFLENAGGAIWRAFTGIADWLERITRPIRNTAAEAWNWLMRQFGLAWENTSGIRQWVTDKATDLWDTFLRTIEPIRGPLLAVGGALVLLSPLGPIIILTQVIPPLWEKIVWLWENWDTEEILVQAREILANDILPGIIGLVTGVSSAIAGAAAWLATAVSSVARRIASVAGAFGANSCLRAVTRIVEHIAEQFQRLDAWAKNGFQGLGDAIRSVFNALVAIFQPILDFLVRLLMVAGNPPMLPLAITAAVWTLCPDPLKPPVIDFVLDLITAFLRATAAFLIALGPLAPLVHSAALGFLAGIRGREDKEKIAASNKIANIAAGGGPQFVAGYVVGLLRGILDGILSPFILIGMIIRLVSAICTAIGDRLAPLLYAANPGLEHSVTQFQEAVAIPPAPDVEAMLPSEGDPPATGPPAAGSESATTATMTRGTGAAEGIPAVVAPGPESLNDSPSTLVQPDPEPEHLPPSVEARFGAPVPRTAVGGRGMGQPAPPGYGPPELGHHGDGGTDITPADAQTHTSTGGEPETIAIPDPAGSPIETITSSGAGEDIAIPDTAGLLGLDKDGDSGEIRAPSGAHPDALMIDEIDPGSVLDVSAAGSDLAGADEEMLTSGENEARSEGSSVDGLAGLLGGLWERMMGGARDIGGRMASGLMSFLELSDYNLGNKIGFIAGVVLFEVFLSLLTGGGWLAVRATAMGLRPLIRFLNLGGEILVGLGRALGALRGPILSALGTARGFMSRFPSAARFLDRLETGARSLFRLGDDAAVASSRNARQAAEQTAEATGTRGVARTGRAGADGTGTRTARQIDDTAESLSTGARRSDDAAKAAEYPAATAAARGICELHDRRNAALPVLFSHLYTLRARFRWIRGFRADYRGGHYRIHMLASDTVVDPHYTTAVMTEEGDIVRASSPPDPVVEYRPGGSGVRPDASASPTPRTEPASPAPRERFPDLPEHAPRRTTLESGPVPAQRVEGELATGTLEHTTPYRVSMTRPPRHHALPQEHINYFQDRGFHGRDIDAFTLELDEAIHQAIHGGGNWRLGRREWEGEWNRAIMRRLRGRETELGRKLTRAEVLQEARQLMTEYGLPSQFIHYDAPRGLRSGYAAAPPRLPKSIHRVLSQSSEPLPNAFRERAEAHFGRKLEGVRLHRNSVAAQAARDSRAHAVTVGSRIILGSTRSDLRAPETLRTLAHEVTHTQQTPTSTAARPEAFEPDHSPREAEARETENRFPGMVHVHASSGSSTPVAPAELEPKHADATMEQEACVVAQKAARGDCSESSIRSGNRARPEGSSQCDGLFPAITGRAPAGGAPINPACREGPLRGLERASASEKECGEHPDDPCQRKDVYRKTRHRPVVFHGSPKHEEHDGVNQERHRKDKGDHAGSFRTGHAALDCGEQPEVRHG